MEFSKAYRTALAAIFSLILFSACSTSNADSITNTAEKIRLAINRNNVELLRSLTVIPLSVREQEWESAQDGSGFVLGKVKETTLSTKSDFNNFMPAFLKSVEIEGEKASTDITLDMFTDELGKNIKYWSRFNLVLFKRGEGDVEHIVLIGLNKTSRKMEAIYIN